jgi:hypothetical protein
MPAPLGIADPSLPFVTLNRWIENLETLAILRKISDAGASESTVMDSGRPLIGRPGGVSALRRMATRSGTGSIELWYRDAYHADGSQE